MRIIVVDTETTGLSVKSGGRVIELGAVVIEHGEITGEMTTLIDTGADIAPGAFRVHGISPRMLAGQPQPEDVWGSFREFVGDAALVAHNAPFDSAFIRNELALIGVPLPNLWHCTVRLARRTLPLLSNHKLDTVYDHLFGAIPQGTQRHRALDDARMTARIWLALNS